MKNTESGIIKLRLVGDERNVTDILDLFNKDDFETFRRPQKGNNPKYKDNNHVLCYLEIQADVLKNILKKEVKKYHNHL